MTKSKLAKGNIKLGKMLTWSKLYGDHETYVEKMGTSVRGTCGGFCAGCKNSCYVKKSYRYGSVIYGHAKNTLAIRNDLESVYRDIDGQLTRTKAYANWDVRIHQSGELESTAEFLMWCRLAKNHPGHTFYVYTKAFPYVMRTLLTGLVPENFIILFSIWSEYGVAEFQSVSHLPNVKAFVYVDHEFTVEYYANMGIEIQTFCHAYNENGKLNHDITCDKCHKCNRANRVKIIGCYGH